MNSSFQNTHEKELPDIKLELNKDLFDTTAKEYAYSFNIKKPTPTQMRIFYEYVLDLCEKSEQKPFNEILPFLKMLNSKVEYAFGRDTIDNNFKKMITDCVKQINENDKEKLKNFKLFFEAVLGFAKGREFKEKMKKNKGSKKWKL